MFDNAIQMITLYTMNSVEGKRVAGFSFDYKNIRSSLYFEHYNLRCIFWEWLVD